jgi:hypothetical protein
MLIANYTEKSLKGMAGAAKPAARCADSKSITYNCGAKRAMILSTTSSPCVLCATEGFTRNLVAPDVTCG